MRRKPRYVDWAEWDSRIREWATADWTLVRMSEAIGIDHESVRRYCLKNDIPYQRPAGCRAGPESPRWKGGRSVTAGGYVRLKRPGHPFAAADGYVPEHRLVVEEMLGRFLQPDEVVHHIDGNTSNNAPENLELFETHSNHVAQAHKGRPVSDATRQKMREKQQAFWNSEAGQAERKRRDESQEYRQALSDGVSRSWQEGGKKRITTSLAPHCHPCSDETRRKISETKRRNRQQPAVSPPSDDQASPTLRPTGSDANPPPE